jgi:hypothetical protein
MALSNYRNSLAEDAASGTVVYSGAINTADGSMTLLMEFDDYQMKGATTRTLIGSMTMAIAADGTGTLGMNVTVEDGQKSYAWGNFTSVVKPVGNHYEVTFTGRFFDFDHGYVDVTTPRLILEDANYTVYDGQMRFDGQDGSWATLTFSAQGHTVETSGTK